MDFNAEENRLTAGEKALQEGDYQGAIERLESVCQNTKDSQVFSTAQRSLITAYEKSGKIEAAINQCKQLQKLGEVEDKVWATTQLNELNKNQNPLNLTGFVADTPPTTPAQKKPTDSLPPPKKESASKTSSPKQKKKIKAKPNPEVKPTEYTPTPDSVEWKNAPGAKKWKPLKKPSLSLLWRRIIVSFVAFFFVFNASIQLFMEVTNDLLVALPHFRPIQLFYRDPTTALIIFIIIVFLFSPFLLNFILKRFYKCQRLPIYKLNNRCPITAKLAQRYCNQCKIPLPYFGILPTNAPLIFSYRQSPKKANIIFSEGLLNQLSDEEIATLLAGELSMISDSPLFIFSGAIALLQVPYTLYYQISDWGEKLYQWLPKKAPWLVPQWFWRDIPPFIQHSTAYVAQFFYLTYSLWKLPLNWLFQIKHSYHDYLSVALTGNPNAKVRSLIKIAVGINDNIETKQQTDWCLENFSLISPIGHRQGMTFGSLLSQLSPETILNWENSQPYRQQLNWFHSHPLISDRALKLMDFSRKYQLPLELDLTPPSPPETTLKKQVQKLIGAAKVFPLFQRSLYLGMSLGIALRIFFWILGILSQQFNWFALTWLADTESFLTACILFIFSLSLLIGTNHYFPDIKLSSANNNPDLSQWLTNIPHPQAVHSLRISGTLLGRKGNNNWLGQDLILATETGNISLHISSRLGILGNILPGFPRANEFIGKPVIVSGWFRRGIVPWIDVERITNDQRQSMRAGYPIFLTLLALVAAIWGTHLILIG